MMEAKREGARERRERRRRAEVRLRYRLVQDGMALASHRGGPRKTEFSNGVCPCCGQPVITGNRPAEPDSAVKPVAENDQLTEMQCATFQFVGEEAPADKAFDSLVVEDKVVVGRFETDAEFKAPKKRDTKNTGIELLAKEKEFPTIDHGKGKGISSTQHPAETQAIRYGVTECEVIGPKIEVTTPLDGNDQRIVDQALRPGTEAMSRLEKINRNIADQTRVLDGLSSKSEGKKLVVMKRLRALWKLKNAILSESVEKNDAEMVALKELARDA